MRTTSSSSSIDSPSARAMYEQPRDGTKKSPKNHGTSGVWSVPEHERFLEAMALYPKGPWRLITDHVGTRSIKQVQTHAQKYQQKLLRHQRGLLKRKTKVARPEHRVDETTVGQFTNGCIVRQQLKHHHPTAAEGDWPPSSPTTSVASDDSESDPCGAVDEPDRRWSPAPKAPSHLVVDLQALLQNVEPLPFPRDPRLGEPTSGLDEYELQALRETLDILIV